MGGSILKHFYSVSAMADVLGFAWHAVLVLFCSSPARMMSGAAPPTRNNPAPFVIDLYENEDIIITQEPLIVVYNRTGKGVIARVDLGPDSEFIYKLETRLINTTGVASRNRLPRDTKLTQAVSDQSGESVMFKYQSNGSAGNIFAPCHVSDTVFNLIKGIIRLFNINIKTNETVYNLQEPTAWGICNTTYVVPQHNEGHQLVVEKSIDFNDCQDKESKNIGKAFMDYCEPCQRTIISNIATSTIKLKNNRIMEIVSEQTTYYTPLQGHNGRAILKAKQVLTWAGNRSIQNLNIFPDDMCQIPFGLPKTESLEAQIEQIIQQMAQNNQEKIPHYITVELMELIRLLGNASTETLHTIWKQCSQNTIQRTWFLQGLRMTGSEDSLKFAQQIFHDGELTDREAATLIPIVIRITRAIPSAMQIAKELIQDPKVQESPTLYKLIVLTYGSMVKRYCFHLPTCPESALKPLHDLATDALSKVHEEDMTLALKALGNAGQPESLQCIQNFLPGFSSSTAQLPVRNQVDAVMALRNVATRDPRKVQEILLQVYMDREAHTEVRMMASMALLETKPGPAMITDIANVAVRESTDKPQLTSFVYSQVKAFAKSSVPELEPLAAACNATLKLFNASIDNLGEGLSTVIQMDTFKYPLLSGSAVKVYIMKNPTTPSPVLVLGKLMAYIDHTEVAIAELMVRGEQPSQGPRYCLSIKVLHQELIYTDANSTTVQTMIQALNEPTDSDAAVKNIRNELLNGLFGQIGQSVEDTVARHITPTILGLLMEISYYSTAVGNAPVSIDVQMTPSNSPDLCIAQLLDSQIDEDLNARKLQPVE